MKRSRTYEQWSIRTTLLCFVLAVPTWAASLEDISKRPLTPDDFFKLEAIREVVLSPNGDDIVFVRRRALASARLFQIQQWRTGGGDHADIWHASTRAAKPARNLTTGEADDAGYWSPAWSPDGKRLAMLSTKGDGNIRLWSWERDTGKITRLTTRQLAATAPNVPLFAWLDNERLIVVLRPDGELNSQWAYEQRTAATLQREWTKSRSGQQPAASTLDSGVPIDISLRPQEQLAIIDVHGGLQLVDSSFSLRDLCVAPDRRYVAYLKGSKIRPPDSATGLNLRYGDFKAVVERYQVEIVDANGRLITPRADSVPLALPNSFRWAPDSRSFAFIGTAPDEENRFKVFRATIGRSIRSVDLGSGVVPLQLAWGSGGHLFILGRSAASSSDRDSARERWYASRDGSGVTDISATLPSVPTTLLADADGRSLIGIASGTVWALDSDSYEWRRVLPNGTSEISGIAWPTPPQPLANVSVRGEIVVNTRNVPQQLYRIDLATGTMTLLQPPDPHAKLAAYESSRHLALFSADEPDGTRLTLSENNTFRLIVETNQFVRTIESGEVRRLEYETLDGELVRGWLLMPVQYVAGRRYPLVAVIYPGSVYSSDTKPQETSVNAVGNYYNLQLLTARGYSVLLPAMPLNGPTRVDPYGELLKGVLPAIDKAVAVGVADGERLAVMGWSFGGFGTMGLVTQTNRFKCAISIAGISNLLSYYGAFSSAWRYEPFAQEDLFNQSWAEVGQLGLGAPPWSDLGHYLRNSPLFYVDKLQTPLLMVHGDLDGLSITQSEEFFSALYRRGKRARFVRYWGEGHALTSPANIRDLWAQIFSWLDEFLRPGDVNSTQVGQWKRQ